MSEYPLDPQVNQYRSTSTYLQVRHKMKEMSTQHLVVQVCRIVHQVFSFVTAALNVSLKN